MTQIASMYLVTSPASFVNISVPVLPTTICTHSNPKTHMKNRVQNTSNQVSRLEKNWVDQNLTKKKRKEQTRNW